MNKREAIEVLSSRLMIVAAVFSGSVLILIAASLFLRSKPILDTKPLSELIFGMTWMPTQGEFGFFPSILGTLYVTAIAMLLAIPPSILSSIYLVEYASEGLRSKAMPLIDLLAGIPPVVYGAWGSIVVVPMVSYLTMTLGVLGIPFLNAGYYSTGFSILSGSIVLAIMVIPIIISISEQVLRSVPLEMKEASLSLGATKWETIKYIVFRVAFPGIAAAIILGFSRAFGETMAVLMVVGNVPYIPCSLFDPAYPLPALIANNYGEMMSIPLYDSALLLAALILMLVVVSFTIAARLILIKIERGMTVE